MDIKFVAVRGSFSYCFEKVVKLAGCCLRGSEVCTADEDLIAPENGWKRNSDECGQECYGASKPSDTFDKFYMSLLSHEIYDVGSR